MASSTVDAPPTGGARRELAVTGPAVLARPALRWALVAIGAMAVLADVVLTLAIERNPPELLWVASSAAPMVVAAAVLHRRPRHPLGGWLALASLAAVSQLLDGILAGLVREGAGAHAVAWLNAAGQESALIGTIAVAHVLGLFPDGVARRRYEIAMLSAQWVLLLVPVALLLLVREVTLPFYFDAEPVASPLLVTPIVDPAVGQVLAGLLFAPPLLAGIALVVLRYRRAGAEARQAIRWLLVPVVLNVAALATQVLVWSGEPRWLISLLWIVAGISVSVSIGLGLLNPSGSDRALSRTITYAVLWIGITAAYAAIGAATGLAAGQRLPLGWAVSLTVVAAVLFQPARAHLQRIADRWVFGHRPDPATTIAELGATLAETYDVAAVLPRMTQALRTGLDLEWAEVRLDVPGTPPGAASPPPDLRVPILLEGEPVGEILGGGAGSGRPTSTDRALVETFARQAAVAVRNVRLTAELAAKAEELAQSRRALVRAQDAERRRIERDIHDGVQQDLVALIALVGQALPGADRPGIGEDLELVQAGLRRVLADVRDLAQGIHPSVLSDRGLLAAVEALAGRHPVPVTVRADPALRDLRLPEDIEGVGYFTVAESLANSLKHAGAEEVEVALSRTDSRLQIIISDDGAGVGSHTMWGNGLSNLSARLAAVGGRLEVTGEPGSGTRVTATMGVPEEQ